MPIDPRTTIAHPELGSIRFDDGRAVPDIAGARNGPAKWVCMPHGRSDGDDFEIYLPGDSAGPKHLDRAVVALRHRDRIEAEGRRLSASNVSLGWIDLTTDPPNVGFPDEDQIYVLWRGELNAEWGIESFERGNW